MSPQWSDKADHTNENFWRALHRATLAVGGVAEVGRAPASALERTVQKQLQRRR